MSVDENYPRWFKNRETKNVFEFTEEKKGKLHLVEDGVSRFPSDYAIRGLHTHKDSSSWEEVKQSGEPLFDMSDLGVSSPRPRYIVSKSNSLELFKVLSVFSVVGKGAGENSIEVLCECIDEIPPLDHKPMSESILSIPMTAGRIIGDYIFLSNISREKMGVGDEELGVIDYNDFHAHETALNSYRETEQRKACIPNEEEEEEYLYCTLCGSEFVDRYEVKLIKETSYSRTTASAEHYFCPACKKEGISTPLDKKE